MIPRTEEAFYHVASSSDVALEVFNNTTPKIMQITPRMTQKLSGSEKTRMPKIAVRAVPTPDHTAYAKLRDI